MLGRRKFLLQGAALGCSAAASPLLTPITFAQTAGENRLVVIILRGAMDGLDAVRPYGDPFLAGLRPQLARGLPGEGLDLDGFFALHPAMAPLMPLWAAGELGFAHAVSTPYRDARSHFDGQDILEAGVAGPDAPITDGWLNRMLQVTPGMRAETAYAIGQDDLLILRGAAEVARWAPEAKLLLSAQTERLIGLVQEGEPLFEQASAEAIAIAREIAAQPDLAEEIGAMLEGDPMMAGQALNGSHVRLAEFAASRLRGETRIASFSIGGWDTHKDQHLHLSKALGRLATVILAMRAGLGDIWGRTTVLCLTEFGRTARENGTRGTDHGTAGAMIYAGGAVRGGRVIGDWPGLSDFDLYADRDLMPTRDLRALAGWALRGLFSVDAQSVEQSIFPGLDLGDDPGLLL